MSDKLDSFRSGLATVVSPLILIADLPSQAVQGLMLEFSSRDKLKTRIVELETTLLQERAKNLKMDALTLEINRYRDLLGSAAKLHDNFIVAELVGVDPDPGKQEVIIDKGTRDGVSLGQSVLDAHGLMGQIIAVSQYNSRILLISDQSHAVPVLVVRSNLRLIAQGSGISKKLDLQYVQSTADIRQGDQLVSSGLGGRFPVGYPVGTVDTIEHKMGQPFAEITARPSALLNRSRDVLLVFPEGKLANREVNRNDNGG